jgi:hypothetical protein
VFGEHEEDDALLDDDRCHPAEQVDRREHRRNEAIHFGREDLVRLDERVPPRERAGRAGHEPVPRQIARRIMSHLVTQQGDSLPGVEDEPER